MATKKSTPTGQSKAAFVRNLPADTPAREVIERAKVAGIDLDTGYVYNVRSTARSSARSLKAASKKPAARSRSGESRKREHGTASLEGLLKAIGAEVGLARAIEILETERARVRIILRG